VQLRAPVLEPGDYARLGDVDFMGTHLTGASAPTSKEGAY
jgi:hypothetical protein